MLRDIGPFNNGGYVTYNDERGLVLIGSEINYVDSSKNLADQLLHFNESTELFQGLPFTLRHPRQGSSVVLIPDGDINCF